MVKILIYSISCIFLLSGCGGKKNTSSTRTARIKAKAANAGKDSKTQTDPNADSDTKADTGKKADSNPDTGTGSSDTPADHGTSTDHGTTATDKPDEGGVFPPLTFTSIPPAASSPASSPTATPASHPEATSNPNPSKPEGNTPAPSASAEATPASNEELISLTFEESRDLDLIMRSQFSKESLQNIRTPLVSKSLNPEDLDIIIKGTYEKLTLTLTDKKKPLVEFKDIALLLSSQTKLQVDGYNLLGICVGAKCDVAFITLYKVQGTQLTENYPVILKLVDNQYQHAQFMSVDEIQKHLKDKQSSVSPEQSSQSLEETTSKAPPQLRVRYLLESNMNKLFPSLIQRIDARMKKDNSIYSGRFFYNLKSGTFDWILKKIPAGLSLNLGIEFIPQEKKPFLEFKGVIPSEGARLTDKNGITLDVYPVIPNEFYMMIFESNDFKSYLADSKRAIQGYVCQVLEQNNETFSECETLYSAYVLGEWALEGRIGGPVFVNTDKDGKPIIIDKYQPIPVEKIKEQSKAAGGQ